MSKRLDLKNILIIGAGPIVIGQGCEFDYSGVQACKALKAEGYRVILINSNPATIMTDPDLCDATYIEALTWQNIEKIIQKERPDALLATMGGQTALNCALELIEKGVLEKYSVELIGVTETAIQKAEDREQFSYCMRKIGLEVPNAKIATNIETALLIQQDLGFPIVIRPFFTLGGSGGGIAKNEKELREICARGLALSPVHKLLIEESLLGWKEFELEVVRDKNDNCIIVCTIENVDPMGIHTGDSITVAPAQTLTDKEYQRMRNAAIAILREIGVTTGGANVQFALHPKTGRLLVIEMNPRVSRSSALASKATGFPIAKIAAKLAVGYTLDELRNDITKGNIPASFEPTIDYVIVKIPRFHFDKFPNANKNLTTQMKSVGEVMAIGRTFQESLQKALCSLENNTIGLMPQSSMANIKEELKTAGPNRLFFVAEAFRKNFTVGSVAKLTGIDPWFLSQIEDLVLSELSLSLKDPLNLSRDELFVLKQKGFSDAFIARTLNIKEQEVRELRYLFNIHPVFKRVDSCAAEFSSDTAYLYSTYEEECESAPTNREKIIILGSGPNRIGQGIEFDYCCVHASLALREEGYETIMINCNPETVSTDYDISNRLYFEPLTIEHVLEIIAVEKPKGVIVQFGGQTPLKLTKELMATGVPIIGTSPDSIDCAEDRQRFSEFIKKLDLKQPEHGLAYTVDEGIQVANALEYPVIVRPFYVLGGQSMRIIHDKDELKIYLKHLFSASETGPVLIDHFLKDAIEVDIDAVSDGHDVLIGGILEHVEYAGIHSGDSTCSLPPFRLSHTIQNELCRQMTLITKALSIIGPINAQFAIQQETIFILEVNPRASRTVPFLSKATGIPLAKIGALCMVNRTLAEQDFSKNVVHDFYSVKLPVFSFNKFPTVDPLLGPEMRSIGETMGIGKTFNEAFYKSIQGIWPIPKRNGCAFLSASLLDIDAMVKIGKKLIVYGFNILATQETAIHLQENNIHCCVVDLQLHLLAQVTFAIITKEKQTFQKELIQLRLESAQNKISYLTTVYGAEMLLAHMDESSIYPVRALQSIHHCTK